MLAASGPSENKGLEESTVLGPHFPYFGQLKNGPSPLVLTFLSNLIRSKTLPFGSGASAVTD